MRIQELDRAIERIIKSHSPVEQIEESFDTGKPKNPQDPKINWVKSTDPNSPFEVHGAKVKDAYIEISYKPLGNGVFIQFTRNGSMGITGGGSQHKIFGAVINHIKNWVKENNPKEITFSAFKPQTGPFGSQDNTRSKLYDKMLRRFANENGYDYEVIDNKEEDTFFLKKQKDRTE